MKRSLIFGILFLFGSAQAQVPAWYTTHTHRGYQPEFYIVGVGAADGANAIEKAKKHAQADIVSQIKVQVKSEMQTITESYQLAQDETISSAFKSQSRTVVNEEITGASIVETFVDPATQTAYALATLDRERYCEGLRGDMNSAWTQAAELKSSADAFLTRGKLSDALHAIADARTLIVAALPKKALHDAVAGKNYTPPNGSTPLSFTSEMKTMISKVRIEKTHGDKQTGMVGKRFIEPFAVRVLYEVTPVSGVRMSFESTENLPLGESMTDGNGEASLLANVRMLPGNTVRAKLTLAELSKEFERNLLSNAAMFSYTPRPSDIGFELSVSQMKGQTADGLKKKIADAVTKLGYKVLPSAKYRIELSLQHEEPAKQEGFSGQLVTVRVEAIATLVEKESGAVVGTYSMKGAGGGRTEPDAVAKASGTLTVDRMKFADLLEKIQQ
jgi:hypothetical protein